MSNSTSFNFPRLRRMTSLPAPLSPSSPAMLRFSHFEPENQASPSLNANSESGVLLRESCFLRGDHLLAGRGVLEKVEETGDLCAVPVSLLQQLRHSLPD